MITCLDIPLRICVIHLVFSVTQHLSEEAIQNMTEKKWFQDSLLNILLPKLFRHENLNYNQITLRNELQEAIAKSLRDRCNLTPENAKRGAELIVHESLSALVVESYYWGEYQLEFCEWHDTIIVEEESIKTSKGIITTEKDNLEKEVENIRIASASDFEDYYYEGIDKSLRKSLSNDSIKAFKERIMSKEQGHQGPSGKRGHLALPRRPLIVCAVCFLILACSMVLYKYGLPLMFNANHVTPNTELSSDITGENSGIPSERQSFCMLSQDGIVTFSSDSISIIRYKMCSSQEECSRVDWEKPDGLILPTENLYVKNTGWLALKAYSENGNLMIENSLEVDFCMILTNLIRSSNNDMLGKLVDDGTLYSVDNENPEGSCLEDYLRSSYVREAFSEKGGYQVTDYDYAEGQSTELSSLDCPRYPKLKVVYINKRK